MLYNEMACTYSLSPHASLNTSDYSSIKSQLVLKALWLRSHLYSELFQPSKCEKVSWVSLFFPEINHVMGVR